MRRRLDQQAESVQQNVDALQVHPMRGHCTAFCTPLLALYTTLYLLLTLYTTLYLLITLYTTLYLLVLLGGVSKAA